MPLYTLGSYSTFPYSSSLSDQTLVLHRLSASALDFLTLSLLVGVTVSAIRCQNNLVAVEHPASRKFKTHVAPKLQRFNLLVQLCQ